MYKIIDGGVDPTTGVVIPPVILNEETGAFIPQDMGNRHYREYLESLVPKAEETPDVH